MASDNLPRLARKVRKTPLLSDEIALLSDQNYVEEIAALSPTLRAELADLVTDLRAIIPNDFSFVLCFEFAGIRAEITFEDGDTSASAGGGFFTSRRSMLRNLRAIDWDIRRTELLKQSDVYDELLRAADDRPVRIPSSIAAARRYNAELEGIYADLNKATTRVPFILIYARDDFGVYVDGDRYSRGEVVFQMAEVMTTSCDILSVIENGVLWSFEAIEEAKLEAVEQLGPISRAKAEGRYFL